MSKQDKIGYWQQITKDLVKDLERIHVRVTLDQVWQAIQIYVTEQFPDEIEFWTDVFHIYIEYPTLLKYFSAYDFKLNEIEFDTTTTDIHYSHIYMVKAEIKHKGLIWVVHKNDADSFPSSPHAHEVVQQFKLHLGNGNIFKKREQVGKLNKKEFLAVREKLLAKGIALPPL